MRHSSMISLVESIVHQKRVSSSTVSLRMGYANAAPIQLHNGGKASCMHECVDYTVASIDSEALNVLFGQ